MMNRIAFLALVLTFFFLYPFNFATADASFDSTEDFPFLALSKKAIPPIIKLGSSATIELTLINLGNLPAYDIVLVDRLINGSEVRKSFETLSGHESISMTYTVVPEQLGDYSVSTAFGQYNMEEGNEATKMVVSSNVIREETSYYRGEGVDDTKHRGNITVLTATEYRNLHAGHLLNTVCYVFMGIIPALFPYVFFRVKRAEEDVLLKRAKYTK